MGQDRKNTITLPNENDGCPRASGNFDELGDDHARELHLPFSEAPLSVNKVIEWEQLLDISELRARRN